MTYRDDREALRQKNEDLEAELASARAELEKLKDQPSRAIEVARPTAVQRKSTTDRGPYTLIAISVLLAAATGTALSAAGWVTVPLAVWVLGAFLISATFGTWVVVAGPHEAFVLSGATHRRRDGLRSDFRVVHNGRAVLAGGERKERIDMTLFALEVLVPKVATKDDASLDVGLGVCAKIDADPLRLELAVERFRGRDAAAVRDAVRASVVDGARRALTRVRAADLVRHPKSVRHAIQEEVTGDLQSLGIELFALELFAFENAEKEA